MITLRQCPWVNDTFKWRTAQSKLPCLLKYSVRICSVYTSNNYFFLVVELIGECFLSKNVAHLNRRRKNNGNGNAKVLISLRVCWFFASIDTQNLIWMFIRLVCYPQDLTQTSHELSTSLCVKQSQWTRNIDWLIRLYDLTSLTLHIRFLYLCFLFHPLGCSLF